MLTLILSDFQVCFFNVLIMILLALGALMRTEVWKSLITSIISILSANYIIGVMFINLMHKNGTQNKDLRICKTVDTSDLVNLFFNIRGDGDIFQNIEMLFVFLVTVTAFCGLKIRQESKRIKEGEATKTHVIFSDVSRINSDDSFSNLLKFVANYGFYKVGIEITLIMIIIVVFIRGDIFTIPYIFWFILLTFRNREKVRNLWFVATIYVWLSITIQSCALVLVSIFNMCLPNPDNQVEHGFNTITMLIIKSIVSLYANPKVLVCDFILLVLMTSQVRRDNFPEYPFTSWPFSRNSFQCLISRKQETFQNRLRVAEATKRS